MQAVRIWIGTVTLIALVAPLNILAQQAPTRTISYQGVLAGAMARVPDGYYHITFRIYGDSTGEHTLWEDTYNVDVRNSVFSVLLGSGKTPLPPAPYFDRALWLGVALEEQAEFRPLSPLTFAPFALNVPDSSITADKIAPHSITEDKMATQYVKGISIDGYSVTPSGSNHFVNFKSKGEIDMTFVPTERMVYIGTHTNVWTAPMLEGNVNDLKLQIDARYVRFECSQDEAVVLTGIDHEGVANGQMITLSNIGSSPVTLRDHSQASRSGNQFSLPGAGDVIIASHGSAEFIYDAQRALWIFLSGN